MNSAEVILGEIDKLDPGITGNFQGVNPSAVDAIAREFRDSDDTNYFYPVDGSVECFVSADKMSAYLSFYPASPGMERTTLSDVRAELDRNGVTFGVEWIAIEESLKRSNLESVALKMVPIAQGKGPVPDIPRHYVLSERFLGKVPVERDGDEPIDYKAISPYVMVRKGEKLAEIREGQRGMDGITVLGEPIPFQREEHEALRFGDNTQEFADSVIAAIDGVIERKANKIEVKEVLCIQEDVDLHTGHIDFTGDVIIHGSVREGFRIKAQGSVYIDQTIDATELECGSSLHVKQGIIGRKEGRIKVGGDLRARFAENCLIEAGGLVAISAGIIRTSIYTAGTIRGGPKCVVIGGTFFAQDGFRAGQIGSLSAPRTEIYCGLDYTIMKKLEWNKEQALNLALALQKLRAQLQEGPSPQQREQLAAMQEKIKAAIKKLNTISANMVFNLDKNEQACVEVIDRIFPGVYLEIYHVSFVVKKPLSSVRFSLDKKSGTIRAERLA